MRNSVTIPCRFTMVMLTLIYLKNKQKTNRQGKTFQEASSFEVTLIQFFITERIVI